MTEKMLKSIIDETGKSVSDFVKIVQESGETKHGKIRDLFKIEFGLSYGYANTLAHIVRDEVEGAKSGDDLVDSLFIKKPKLKPIYNKLMEHIIKFGDPLEISPKKSYVSLRGKKQFALLQPSTKTRFDVGLILKGKETTDRLEDGKNWNGMCTHRVKINSIDEVDEELVDWLKEAFDATI